ncbi:glycosyltransferase family 4 protein [Enterococcus sp. AZ109]|uniref:glycosyltransferase family 4 protein n=1 Tax=Enterococcus sp. AZ109 TaxID=2774634 RepID=UPI003F23715E
MPKVLIVSTGSKYTYRTRKELVLELLAQGYEVHLLCPHGKELDYFQEHGVRLHNFVFDNHGTNPLKEATLFLKLLRKIHKIKPDIILGYTIKMNIYGAFIAAFLHIPFFPNITGLGTGFSQNNRLENMLVTMYRVSFRKVAHIFFQNEANRSYFEEKKILNSPCTVLPGSGVNLQEYQVVPFKESQRTHFLFLARIIKEKGIEEYLSAAETVLKEQPYATFHVAGLLDESYRMAIECYVNKGVIQYHGDVEDVQGLIEEMDVIVLPSYHEGMANTLLEAAAMGRPIIASHVPGCAEIIEDEVSGYLISPREVLPLIEAIRRILIMSKAELAQMGLQGRKLVENQFDRKLVVESYLELIREYTEPVEPRYIYEEGKHEEFS